MKYEKIEQEIKGLEERKDKLKETLSNLSITNEISNSVLGIDLKVLILFTCFKCSGNLTLEDGIINKNQIIEGKLICSCGEEYTITSGILTAGKSFKEYEKHHLKILFRIIFMKQIVLFGEYTKRRRMGEKETNAARFE